MRRLRLPGTKPWSHHTASKWKNQGSSSRGFLQSLLRPMVGRPFHQHLSLSLGFCRDAWQMAFSDVTFSQYAMEIYTIVPTFWKEPKRTLGNKLALPPVYAKIQMNHSQTSVLLSATQPISKGLLSVAYMCHSHLFWSSSIWSSFPSLGRTYRVTF